MSTTVTLDERYYRVAARHAKELGKTPSAYIQSLIAAATISLDEILRPVRKGFAESKATEDQLDAAVTQARAAVRSQPRRKCKK